MRTAGFTLVELMLVISVLSIIVALSVPAFRFTFRHVQSENLTLDMATLMRYARERAIVERRMYRACMDTHGNRYWLEVDEASESEEESFSAVRDRWGGVHSIPVDISIESSAEFVTFYPDGRADEIAISVSSGRGRSFTLITHGATGRVEVLKDQR